MSRNWVTTVLCLLSYHGLSSDFVDASGIVRLRITDYEPLHKTDVIWAHRKVYNVTLKQPSIRDSFGRFSVDEKTPITFHFKKWTSTLEYRITARVQHAMISNFSGTISQLSVRDGERRLELKNSFEILRIRVRVTCDFYFFGAGCTRHCRSQDEPRGHYFCTSLGFKRCLPNWRHAAANCTVPAPCRPGPCRNGAVCGETVGDNFICRCPPAFRGRLCEIPRSPCPNGVAGCPSARPRWDNGPMPVERTPAVVSASLLPVTFAAGAATAAIIVVGGLLCWRRATRREVRRPPQRLQVEWRSDCGKRVLNCDTMSTFAP